MDGAIRTKNNICASVHAHIPNAEVDVVDRPVAIRAVQGCVRELAYVFAMIDAAKLDTGRAVRACNFEVQGEALHLRDRKRSW